jgi:hypothetical protein
LTKAPGEDAWKEADRRPADQRATFIAALGREWAGLDSDHTQIPEEYLGWLHTVTATFGTKDAIADGTQEDLTAGLLSLHAFYERLRFVDGGLKNLPRFFWATNQNDVAKVRRSLSYLVHGSGEFVNRLNDFLSVPETKLAHFGKFCALELFGTVRPDLCPPMNGRTAKAMRFLGYPVTGV